MSLFLLLPAGLAALTALLLPLLIHLARRSEQRPTVFAALRWLQAKPRPRHRLRFDEWLLLIVRLLLLALLALILAQPVLRGADDTRPYVAVAPGIATAALDDLRAGAADARLHWLTPGFPAVGARGRGTPSSASPTSLLRELDARLAPEVRLSVVVPAVLEGVDGERPRLSRAVEWRVVPAEPTPARRVLPDVPPHLVVRHVPERRTAVRYLRAAQAAWPPGAGQAARAADVADVSAMVPPEARTLVWLAPGPVPAHVDAWVRDGGTVLLDAQAVLPEVPTPAALWRDATGRVMVEAGRHGRGRVLRFTQPLVPASMPELLEGTFPTRLRRVLAPLPPPPARVHAVAHAPRTGAPAYPIAPQDLTGPLAVLAALLFLVERWLATGRRARATA